jgi:hypothetical protein
MTRVCLYTRISTDEENQPTSLASQHERLEAFCKVQEDWRIIAHHEDRATGTKLDRPGLQAALDLARQGRIDQLLVYRGRMMLQMLTDRAALTEKRASLAKEITRAERAIERYHDAFENGDLDPARFKERLSALDSRLDALHGQDQTLALELAADTPTTPDTATLRAVADQLDHVITNGEPEQAKALLAILIADLRINSRAEILPTYRVGTPVVCAPTSSVEPTGIEPVTSCLQRRSGAWSVVSSGRICL